MRRFLSLLLLTASSLAAATSPAQLGNRIEALRKQHGIASAAIVLVDRRQTLFSRSYGVLSWENPKPVNAATLFRVGSITKSFTALAALRAQSHGLVALSQPVRILTPKAPYENPWEGSQPLTLENLLEHTAGWPDLSALEFNSNDSKPLTLEEALALHPASRKSLWSPGLHPEYSNSGAGLASYVLQQRSGKSFEQYLDDAVLAPLGMTSASMNLSQAMQGRLAQGYDHDGRTPLPYWHMLYRGAAGLNLAPSDMAPFLRMLLNRGRSHGGIFLHPQDIERLEQPHTSAAARAGWRQGYGLGVRSYMHRGHLLFGHGGDADGYLSQFAYSRESGLGFFIVISAFNNAAMDTMQALAEDWLIETLPAINAAPPVVLSSQTLETLSGEYFAASSRFPAGHWQGRKLRIRSQDDHLIVRDDRELEQDLLPLDSQRFRVPGDVAATLIFLRQGDGSVILQGSLGNWVRPTP